PGIVYTRRNDNEVQTGDILHESSAQPALDIALSQPPQLFPAIGSDVDSPQLRRSTRTSHLSKRYRYSLNRYGSHTSLA
ncbi:unnamed protein product, partial [Dovyalis caffra]